MLAGTMRRFLTLATLVFLSLLASCSKAPGPGSPPSPSSTTPCYAPTSIPRGTMVVDCVTAGIGVPTLESSSYQVINSAWLAGFETKFKADLFNAGVTKWDPRFDCIYYVHAFIAEAQEQYHLDSYGKAGVDPALAIVWINYLRDTDVAYAKATNTLPEAHAIVLVLTDRGARILGPTEWPNHPF